MIICKHCNRPTVTVSPIVFKRFSLNKFHVSGACGECFNTKGKFLNTIETPMLPDYIYDLPIPGTVLEYISNKSGNKIKMINFLDKIINI
jgi:hypothetical protein